LQDHCWRNSIPEKIFYFAGINPIHALSGELNKLTLKVDPIMFSQFSSSIAAPPYSAKRNLHHVFFFCDAPEAEHVMLAGDFNRGDPMPMRRMPDGRWMASLELPHGHHRYIFLVDGKPVLDPHASGKTRNERNEPVSLIAVS